MSSNLSAWTRTAPELLASTSSGTLGSTATVNCAEAEDRGTHRHRVCRKGELKGAMIRDEQSQRSSAIVEFMQKNSDGHKPVPILGTLNLEVVAV